MSWRSAMLLILCVGASLAAQPASSRDRYSIRRVDDVMTLRDDAADMTVSVLLPMSNAYEIIVGGRNLLRATFRTLDEFRAKPGLNGVPMLWPFANRLDEPAFYANGKRYGFDLAFGNVRGPIPIHGLVTGTDQWQLVESGRDRRGAWVTSRLEFHRIPAFMHQFPFAHTLTMTPEKGQVLRYWALQGEPDARLSSPRQYVEGLLDVLTEAVRCRLRSAKPVGSMLSGGMDSSSVCALGSELLDAACKGPLLTFSGISPHGVMDPETRAIEAAMAMPGLAPTTVSCGCLDDFQPALEKLTWNSSEPFDGHMTLVRTMYLAARQSGVNVVLDGVPTPFDAIEFDDALATIDVLYDLAFLLMDLWHRNLRAHANLVFNRYLDAADETDGLPALPFFMAVRASIRAHVTATQAKGADGEQAAPLRAEAEAYFALSERLVTPCPHMLVAVGGFSGSGKSTLAAGLAPHLGPAPDVSERVYAEMRAEAARTLTLGHAVVADAVFDRAELARAIAEIARDCGTTFKGFWLQAARDDMAARIVARRGDPSDATPAVLDLQMQNGAAPDGWRRLEASRAREEILAEARAALS